MTTKKVTTAAGVIIPIHRNEDLANIIATAGAYIGYDEPATIMLFAGTFCMIKHMEDIETEAGPYNFDSLTVRETTGKYKPADLDKFRDLLFEVRRRKDLLNIHKKR